METKLSIEITKEQLNDLKIFLSRADLKGIEVERFVEIVNILNNPKGKEKDGKKT